MTACSDLKELSPEKERVKNMGDVFHEGLV